MEEAINRFLTYLKEEKSATGNTLESYERDLRKFSDYAEKSYISIERIEPINVIVFLNNLKKEGKSISTLNRTLSAINTFIKFAYEKGYSKKMVTLSKIAVPRQRIAEKHILTKKEIGSLRKTFAEEEKKPAGLRDKVIFEMMYTTGLKPTDIINLRAENINTGLGYVVVPKENGKEEIKNLDTNTLKLVKDYMQTARIDLLNKANSSIKESVENIYSKNNGTVFLNKSGEKLTRQSVWKSLKKYADKANIEKDLASNVLYDSYLYHKTEEGE